MKKTIAIMLAAIFISAGFAAESVAIIKNVSGTVSIKRMNSYISARQGEWLYANDVIRTEEQSSAGFIFNDGTVVSVGPKSMMNINNFLFNPAQNEFDFDLSIEKGAAAFESGNIGKLAPQKFKVRVPQGLVGIRGTKFIVESE